MGSARILGAVAAGHRATADAAAFALREGGNAFDAVIAAHWSACVAEPVLTSLGGGGFLIAEPHGLAQLWRVAKEKLRLWPFPH